MALMQRNLLVLSELFDNVVNDPGEKKSARCNRCTSQPNPLQLMYSRTKEKQPMNLVDFSSYTYCSFRCRDVGEDRARGLG